MEEQIKTTGEEGSISVGGGGFGAWPDLSREPIPRRALTVGNNRSHGGISWSSLQRGICWVQITEDLKQPRSLK